MNNKRLGRNPFDKQKKYSNLVENITKNVMSDSIKETDTKLYQIRWITATFIVRSDLLEKLKDLAYIEQKKIKNVLNEALELYLKNVITIKKKKKEI
jgi:hypothetical protein